MSDLTSFHLFPQLSNEIPDIIWQHTLKPRYVKITARSSYQSHMDEEYCLPASAQTYSNFCFQSLEWPRSALPVALQVHRASRTGILPLYPLMFEGSFHKPPKSANERQRQFTRAHLNALMSPARFNPQLDTLVLLNYPTLLLAGTFFSSHMALIRHLVVFLGNAQRDVLPTALAAFEKLEGITWFLNKRGGFSTYLSLPRWLILLSPSLLKTPRGVFRARKASRPMFLGGSNLQLRCSGPSTRASRRQVLLVNGYRIGNETG